MSDVWDDVSAPERQQPADLTTRFPKGNRIILCESPLPNTHNDSSY